MYLGIQVMSLKKINLTTYYSITYRKINKYNKVKLMIFILLYTITIYELSVFHVSTRK